DGGYRKHGYDIATMAPRSSGSTVKPFTLAVALEEGHSLDETRYAANCIVVPYHVCNADIAESGTFTLAEALALSVNTVYAPLFVQVGMSRVLALAHAAGMATPTGTPDDFQVPYPAKGLGVTVSPLSEAVAFATLADHGVRHDPRMLVSVASQDGGASYHAGSPAGRRVLPAGIDNEVTTAMQGVVDHGTGTLAAQPFPVYGKTGTTSNYDDAWFTGCTPALCIAVWMGYDKPRSMTQVEGVHDVVGGSLPAEIFAHTWDNLRALHAAESLAPGSPVPSVPASAAGTSPAPAPAPSLTPSPSTPASPTHQPSPGRSPGSSPSPTATQPSSPPLPIPTPSGPVPSAASRSP
ncbi:MAG TPA: penicillin-binding transpeptidase domain-containing protein, partial [Mycobacteriales bacterium]|nr:penicillin-binding transpeptidase domain-containing protein [Mycobacteriales bacterium]